ncbi:MAG TPA: hypothetical protein VGH28_09360 [Polyangiaceae bacterium]|jgi:hypothetical protein
MKKSTKWITAAALVGSGAFAFACGGGNKEANPPAGGSSSAPAASSAAPAESTAPAASSAAVAPAPPLVVVAMKMMIPKAKAPVDLKDDGTVMVNGKLVMKFVGAALQGADGKTLVSVAADGTVTLEGASKAPKFNEKDELMVGDGAKMFVGDDGAVRLVNPDGKQDKDSGKLKFVGFKPTAKRAALVLVLAALMPSEAPATGATSLPKNH